MIDDPAARLNVFRYLRNVPLSPAERDLMTGLAPEIQSPLSFPQLNEIASVFGNVQQSQADTLDAISVCSTAACDLTIALMTLTLNTHRSEQVRAGIQICVTEILRLSGSLFPLQHHFWETFYRNTAHMRLTTWTAFALDTNPAAAVAHVMAKSKFGLFLLPLDALYMLSRKENQLTHEMLRQSLNAVFSAKILYAASSDTAIVSAQLGVAANLAARLNLRSYEAWLARTSKQLLSNTAS